MSLCTIASLKIGRKHDTLDNAVGGDSIAESTSAGNNQSEAFKTDEETEIIKAVVQTEAITVKNQSTDFYNKELVDITAVTHTEFKGECVQKAEDLGQDSCENEMKSTHSHAGVLSLPFTTYTCSSTSSKSYTLAGDSNAAHKDQLAGGSILKDADNGSNVLLPSITTHSVSDKSPDFATLSSGEQWAWTAGIPKRTKSKHERNEKEVAEIADSFTSSSTLSSPDLARSCINIKRNEGLIDPDDSKRVSDFTVDGLSKDGDVTGRSSMKTANANELLEHSIHDVSVRSGWTDIACNLIWNRELAHACQPQTSRNSVEDKLCSVQNSPVTSLQSTHNCERSKQSCDLYVETTSQNDTVDEKLQKLTVLTNVQSVTAKYSVVSVPEEDADNSVQVLTQMRSVQAMIVSSDRQVSANRCLHRTGSVDTDINDVQTRDPSDGLLHSTSKGNEQILTNTKSPSTNNLDLAKTDKISSECDKLGSLSSLMSSFTSEEFNFLNGDPFTLKESGGHDSVDNRQLEMCTDRKSENIHSAGKWANAFITVLRSE